jgi:O-antigen ligase
MHILRTAVGIVNREKIVAILTSKYWLLATLSGIFFFFFALNRGGYIVCVHVSFIFLVFNAMFGQYSLREIPATYIVTAVICAAIIITSFIVAPYESHTRWMRNLGRMLIIIFSIHLLSQKHVNEHITSITFIGTVLLSVCWQVGAFYLFKMPYGTFSNLHYLSSFAVLTIPLIVYGMLYFPGWYKLFTIVILIMDIDLLMQTGSRPAIIGIVVGSLVILFFFTRGRLKWIGLALIVLLCVALYITDYADIGSRFEELIVNLTKEERVQFWGQAMNKLTENTALQWLFGHGIQRFPVSYIQDSFSPAEPYVFPHNHLLEILYLNGIVGALLVLGGLAFVFVGVIKVALQNPERQKRILINCTLVVFLSWLIHSGLTFPFYSKYSVLPMALILGTMLVLIGQPVDDQGSG